ncbi:amidase domain-containing protein [Mycobacteroides salmoniphilum]|uniref:amidase domain-containing protein n=1 Tax=Mycobacteroides salmoniphilum TaxID=404941 RepID=UPI00356301AA
MSGTERSTEALTAVTDCRDLAHSGAVTRELPARDLEQRRGAEVDAGRRLAAFAAGGVLVVGAVAALHNLYRGGDGVAELIGWAGLLLLGMTALGGGVKLAMWGAKPVTSVVSDEAEARLSEPLLAMVAAAAVLVGALGMWWTFRGGYSSWWQHLTGENQWSLLLGVGQMLVAVLAGAALFTGGKYLTGLAKEVLTDSGLLIERDRAAGRRRAQEGLWHPGLVAALIAGGLGLVLLTAGITPRLYVWITGPDVLPAIASIAFVLLWAIGSNLGWWKGLGGLYKWATDASQKATATAGVVAVLMFSASGLGLGWFTPATVPQAHAACPPDCGGPGGSDGPPGGGQMFQPPSQGGAQMPDYQGGINQPPMDQNGSVSIYNTQAPSISNNGANGSSGQQGPQQGWDQPAHGTQIPDYQNATPYTQGPGRPNPDFNPGSQGGQDNSGSQGGQPNQGVQQPAQQPQQAPQQQPPQQNTGQEPNQQPQQSDQQKIDDLTRQLQEKQQQSSQDRQRADDLTKQLQQNKQSQKQQQSTKFPSKDKKKDDKDEQDDRDKQSGDNDLTALLLGAASTRRRKQDEQQGPDTQALGQDASQLGQSLPGDIANTVSDSSSLGQSAGSAAQNFGQAGQAGVSLASSAQSGAVNPQDVMTVVQGVSGGVKDTADAVKSGSQIASTWLENGSQTTEIVSDASPQTKQQMQQLQQFLDDGKQGADGVNKIADLTSQGAGAVNSGVGMDPSQMQSVELMSGDATTMSGPFTQGGGDKIPQLPPPSADRQKAIDYTDKWANGANPEYRDFGVGYECTNFVSQAMREGGFKDVGPNITDLRGGDSDEWYYQRDPFQINLGIGDIPSQPHSTTWSLARENHNFITQHSGRGSIVGIAKIPADPGNNGAPDKGALDPLAPSKAGLIPGDLIYYKEGNGDISHVAMLVGRQEIFDPQTGKSVLTDIVNQHASPDNSLRNDWMPESADYSNGQAEFVHLVFPGE